MINFDIEKRYYTQGFQCVVGSDEAGRGAWAGPVVAAAVCLDPHHIPQGLDDSKKLTASKREALAQEIMRYSKYQIIEISAQEIDEINILQASLKAMQRAIEALKADCALIDGLHAPKHPLIRYHTLVKGDSKSLSIAAASILAKTHRDRLMRDLSRKYPGYGWEKNAGYGTSFHKNALLNLGVTPLHRRSYKPIHNILYGLKK